MLQNKMDRAAFLQLTKQVMQQNGLQPNFSQEEIVQVDQIKDPAPFQAEYRDLRSLLWCSIDNEDSRDLDQLTYAEIESQGTATLWIAVADVDALVEKDSPIDRHARINTTSVYTPAGVFAMLPEKLSTNLTSLNENEDRIALVIKIQISQTGVIENSSIFQGIVRNYAKLTYKSVGQWLEGSGALPEGIRRIPSLEKVLRNQHAIAQILKQNRKLAGSLTLEVPNPEIKISSNNAIIIQAPIHNFAHQLIEEFMIAANRVVAKHFTDAKLASLRRVVRKPKYWSRIIELAKGLGTVLPKDPDSKALESFLVNRQKMAPDSFPDLSLAVLKLLGRGEYIVETGATPSVGHFALAVADYAHFTAPNRRFPDLIAQRQYKAFLRREKTPYPLEELEQLATHCTQQEEAAMKVERQVNKSAAAISLSSQIGMTFSGIITGASKAGTWVRLFSPAVEGRIVYGFENLKVGDRVSIKLKNVDILKGFIDFEKEDA